MIRAGDVFPGALPKRHVPSTAGREARNPIPGCPFVVKVKPVWDHYVSAGYFTRAESDEVMVRSDRARTAQRTAGGAGDASRGILERVRVLG